jgi:predicted RND superfamily exporter protein
VKLGLIAMIPNLLPIAFILGTMGWTGVPIDLANIIIASIILGIAVDDTIHFLHQFRVSHRQTGDVSGAIKISLEHSGRAIVSTSMILTCGFLVYIVASMVNLQRFGWLIALAIIYALLVDLVVGPALLRLFYPEDAEPKPQPEATS